MYAVAQDDSLTCSQEITINFVAIPEVDAQSVQQTRTEDGVSVQAPTTVDGMDYVLQYNLGDGWKDATDGKFAVAQQGAPQKVQLRYRNANYLFGETAVEIPLNFD